MVIAEICRRVGVVGVLNGELVVANTPTFITVISMSSRALSLFCLRTLSIFFNALSLFPALHEHLKRALATPQTLIRR